MRFVVGGTDPKQQNPRRAGGSRVRMSAPQDGLSSLQAAISPLSADSAPVSDLSVFMSKDSTGCSSKTRLELRRRERWGTRQRRRDAKLQQLQGQRREEETQTITLRLQRHRTILETRDTACLSLSGGDHGVCT